jgi:hypothetical protein
MLPSTGIGVWGAIQSVSPSFGVELRPVDVHDAGEIERVLTAYPGASARIDLNARYPSA